MDDTLLQFGRPAAAAGEAARPSARAKASVCPRCAHHFSPDGRFCPFDGEALQPAPDWDPGTDALIGSVVDNRYEVLSVLGEGGMGIVYEVRHRALGKHFALKALRKDLASDGEIAARFMQEARTAASVSHPGLVEITDFGSLPSGQPFFVMELLEGQSLAALIRRGGPIPAGRGVDIIRQVAEALAAAHERSIIHRDLKPDNIHITPVEGGRDRVTIVDFGLARVIGASRLTRAGMVFGTPHYMSPEQAMGEVTDHRADVYALGVVMYEMFTGSVPFEADSYMGVLTKHMYMAPTPPSQVAGTGKLGALEGMLLRCLEKKPEQRYASLRDLIRDLDRLLSPGDTIALMTPRRGAVRSLLADELELPSREEVSRRTDDRLPMTRPGWLFSVIGALFLAGTGAVFVARSCLTSSAQRTLPVTTSALAPTAPAAPDTSALVQQHPALNAAASASASAAAVSSTALQVSPALASGSGGTRKPSPRRTVGVAGGPKKKPSQVAGSEIVDPWAK
ncbi:MAG: serine/threonine-protein kinase [Pseudomonadota bacterium]